MTLGQPGGQPVAVLARGEAAPQRWVRSVLLEGLPALAALDRPNPALPPPQRHPSTSALGTASALLPGHRSQQPALVLVPGRQASGSDGSSWRAVLCSAHLASLPDHLLHLGAAADQGKQQMPRQPGACGRSSRAVTRLAGGIALDMSLAAGDSALSAIQAAECIARAHTCLRRLAAVAAAAAPKHCRQPQPGATAAADPWGRPPPPAPPFHLPGCGRVTASATSLTSLVLTAAPGGALPPRSPTRSAAAAAPPGSQAEAGAGGDHGTAAQSPAQLLVHMMWHSPDPRQGGGQQDGGAGLQEAPPPPLTLLLPPAAGDQAARRSPVRCCVTAYVGTASSADDQLASTPDVAFDVGGAPPPPPPPLP